ncbi:MAG: response regulator, partial [Actinomyces dentalis]
MRILLADDAALLREGLAGLLAAAGHEVVAQVADADALRTEVARLATAGELPDVVVTDVRMPPTRTDDGLRAAVDLRAAHPGLPVVVLSAYVAGPYLGELLEGVDGAVGYLLKERVGRVSDFLRSLDVVVSGASAA